jgi:hypothetical protein
MIFVEIHDGIVSAGPFEVESSLLPDLSCAGKLAVDVTKLSNQPKEGDLYDGGIFTSPLAPKVSLELLRDIRTEYLERCDWRDLPSYPYDDQVAWRAYRQDLRDITKDYVPVAAPVFPTEPS